MQQLLCCCCWRARTVGRPVFGCLKIPRTHAASEEKKVDREASLSNHKTGAHDTGTHKKNTHTQNQQQGEWQPSSRNAERQRTSRWRKS